MASLTRDEAQRRAALVEVRSMDVDLDLDQGDEHFRSRTTVRFTCHEPGAESFLDLRPFELRAVRLNGTLIRAGVDDARVRLPGLLADNLLEADTVMAYSRDGQGLHRAVDPADGESYVYGHLFLDAAPTVFACFDQPDLKAPYAVHVTAPVGWRVLGNGAATEVSPGQWELARTPPLATYFVTICAGPYVSVRDEHDGIPLGLHARSSLQGALERHAPQMLEVTKASLDYYHQLFGIRYPFGQYHQVFVPEFNAGAMENPGCVTFRDQYLYRGAATRDQVLSRSNTIAHEMAHMWFGDLVTMRWWDDLWLNESFAEYMAHRTCVAATEFTDAWVDSTMARKVWGYAAERSPSRHPVAGSPAPDARSALNNFDGISYAKGAAVIRQLIAYIGDPAFVAGVVDYLGGHAYGNGTLADFLAAMERASGTDLSAWSTAWLETAGLDTLSADAAAGVIERRVPGGHPADRPHTLDIAGFTDGQQVFRVEATVTADRAQVADLAAAPPAAVVVPNASDLTWATVALDRHTLARLPGQLGQLPDEQARAVVWVGLLDGLALGVIDPRHVLAVFDRAWPQERNPSVLARVVNAMLTTLIPRFLPPGEHEQAEATVATAAQKLLEEVLPTSAPALAAARALARASADVALLRRWAAGEGAAAEGMPAGWAEDTDLRWLVVRNLARRGAIGAEELEVFRSSDNTLQGGLNALGARASMPDAAVKAWAWSQLTSPGSRSNYELDALASGFWETSDLDLVRDYVPRYFEDVPQLAGWLGEDALGRVATSAYPANAVEQATAEVSQEALARADLTPAVRRAMVDADSALGEALRSRRRFG